MACEASPQTWGAENRRGRQAPVGPFVARRDTGALQRRMSSMPDAMFPTRLLGPLVYVTQTSEFLVSHLGRRSKPRFWLSLLRDDLRRNNRPWQDKRKLRFVQLSPCASGQVYFNISRYDECVHCTSPFVREPRCKERQTLPKFWAELLPHRL